MKLFELTGVKSLHNTNLLDIISLMNKKGMLTRLGTGKFSEVFIKGTQIYKFWLEDTGYENYIDYCNKNKSNPFLPKFNSEIKSIRSFFIRPEEFPDNIKYIKMERLSPNVPNEYYKINDKPVEIQIKGMNGTRYVVPHKLCELFAKDKVDLEHIETIEDEKIKNDLKLLNKTMQDIQKIAKQHSFDLDFHSENVMYRHDQLVITDPFLTFESIDLDKIRIKLQQHALGMVSPYNKFVSGRKT